MSIAPQSPEGDKTPRRYRSFAIYSGRYHDRRAPIYENTLQRFATPLVDHEPDVFLDVVSGGIVTDSNVSLYIRVYDDGTATYLGPEDRFRAMPLTAANRWNFHARRFGLPVIGRAAI